MILRRHSFIVFVVIAAVVLVLFLPLLSASAHAGRHYPRTSLVLSNAAFGAPIVAGPSFLSSFSAAAVNAQITRSGNLIELNCARLC